MARLQDLFVGGSGKTTAPTLKKKKDNIALEDVFGIGGQKKPVATSTDQATLDRAQIIKNQIDTTPVKKPEQEIEEELYNKAIGDPIKEDIKTEEVVTPEDTVTEDAVTEDAVIEEPSTDYDTVRKQLAEDIRRQKLQGIEAGIANRLSGIERTLDREKEALAPGFRTERAQIGVQDVMNKQALANLRAGQGLSGAGARGQDILGQNVLTGGRIAESQARESQQISDIEAKRSEARIEAEYDLETARGKSNLENLQAQLDEINIQSEREYEDYVRELEKADERELLDYKNEITVANKFIDAEIKEALAIGDFERAKQLDDRRTANDIKLEGIKQTNRLEEISARAEATGEEGSTTSGFSTSAITKSIDNAIGRKETDLAQASSAEYNQAVSDLNDKLIQAQREYRYQDVAVIQAQIDALQKGTSELTTEQEKGKAMAWIIENQDAFQTPEQLQEVLLRYGITPEELLAREQQIMRVSPSIGF